MHSFGDYQLIRMLGRGKSSFVHLALDPQGRRVALKIPNQDTLRDPVQAERFANEVRISQQLRHARLVSGHGGETGGPGAHLAMTYFPDGSLSERLQKATLAPATSLGILRDVALGLTFLHARHMVHQDVKPQNVYLDEHHAALGDFGTTFFVTQGGTPSGSPFYMAPEIYLGELGSSASDVYSFGVMAHELLTGERPFEAATYDGLMAAHINRLPTPINRMCADIPRPAAQLLDRCLAKRPEERPTIEEVHAALETVVQTRSAPEVRTEEHAVTPSNISLGRRAPSTSKTTETQSKPQGGLRRFFNR